MPELDTASDVSAGWLSRLWRALLACGRNVPVVLTTATAFFSSLTALGVYQGEQNRQAFERMRHAYEVYRDYGNYLDNHAHALPCMEVLTQLSSADLVNVMRYVETANFRYDPARHKGLPSCLDTERQRQLAASGEWAVEDTRYIRFKMLSQIGALDTALLSFYNDIGDKGIICDNFRGLFLVGTIRDFYAAAISARVVNADNYGNVKAFAEMIAKGDKCPAPVVVDRRGIAPLERYKALLLGAPGGSGH